MGIAMKCYYLHDNRLGKEALYHGFSWLKQRSRDTGGLIAVPSLIHLINYSTINGLRSLNLLAKPPYRAIIDGITYDIILPSKIIRHGINRPMLVVHPSREFWNKLNHVRDISEIFMISNINVIREWKTKAKINTQGYTPDLNNNHR